MTEEIIIDGVNVAGCPNYYKKDGSCMSGDCECTLCIHNDCYYKEFKRLEQENKDLKDNNNHLQVIIDDGRAENKRFREENRELKAYKDVNEDFKKAWDELNKKYTEVLKLAKTNADSNEYCLQELEQKYEQLRSALEEIRDYLNTLTTVDSDFVNTETYLRINDKIEEVLKNEV